MRFIVILCIFLSSLQVMAQSDSIIYKDSTVIHYTLNLASGNRMPAFVAGVMPTAVYGCYNYFNGAYFSADARTVLQSIGADVYSADFFIPIIGTKRYRSTGKMFVAERIEYPYKWKYYMGFNSVSEYLSLGLSGGFVRFNAANHVDYNQLDNPLIGSSPLVMSANGLELGVGVHVRSGVILSVKQSTRLNCNYHKFNFRVTYYKARSVVYNGDTLMSGNVPIGAGMSKEALYPSNIGIQVGYTSQVCRSAKLRDSRMFGSWFPIVLFHCQVRYNPMFATSTLVFSSGIGIGFAMRPRYYSVQNPVFEDMPSSKPVKLKIKEGKRTRREEKNQSDSNE